jgi:hypothetical protein
MARIAYADKDNPRCRLDSVLAKWVRISELNTSSYELDWYLAP